MPTADPLQFITLQDFTPGIYADWQASGGAMGAKDGAAQLNGTFGCVCSPSGGLMPGPRKVDSLTQTLFDADTTRYPAGGVKAVINAFGVLSGRIYTFDNAGAQVVPNIGMHRFCYPFIGFQWYYQPGMLDGTFSAKSRTRAYKTFIDGTATPPTYDVIDIASTAFTPTNPIAYGPGGIAFSRSNTVDASLGGFPVAYASQEGGDANAIRAYPSNLTPTLDSTATPTFTSGNAAAALFTHQNRLFLLTGASANAFNQFGGVAATIFNFIDSTELIDYTQPNDYSNGSGLPEGIVFSPEQPNGYGTWVSMNASQLMLIKVIGGAISILGDIDNPSVTHYPGVPSTGLDKNIGVSTPIGYVYGSTTGVWAWPGGDSAKNISKQLKFTQDMVGDPWLENTAFWRVTSSRLNPGAVGSFSYSDPYIFAPNNFLYDVNTGGWWRYENPATRIYNWHDTCLNTFICAAPLEITPTQTEVMAWWDVTRGASTYQWVSQPLQKSRGRFLDIRELDVLALGTGQITISAQGLDGAVAVPQVINVNTTSTPLLVSLPFSIKSSDVVVTVLATSGGTGPAPRLLRMSLGYYEAETARASS